MKNKYSPLLFLSTAICSGTILINRFVVPIPDTIAIILLLVAALSLVIYMLKAMQERKSSRIDKS